MSLADQNSFSLLAIATHKVIMEVLHYKLPSVQGLVKTLSVRGMSEAGDEVVKGVM